MEGWGFKVDEVFLCLLPFPPHLLPTLHWLVLHFLQILSLLDSIKIISDMNLVNSPDVLPFLVFTYLRDQRMNLWVQYWLHQGVVPGEGMLGIDPRPERERKSRVWGKVMFQFWSRASLPWRVWNSLDGLPSRRVELRSQNLSSCNHYKGKTTKQTPGTGEFKIRL